jgi:hypothetical protein
VIWEWLVLAAWAAAGALAAWLAVVLIFSF